MDTPLWLHVCTYAIETGFTVGMLGKALTHSIIIHHSAANPAFSARPAPDYPDYPDYLDVFVVVPCICPFACGCPYVEILIKPAGIDSVVETTRQIGELYAVSY